MSTKNNNTINNSIKRGMKKLSVYEYI